MSINAYLFQAHQAVTQLMPLIIESTTAIENSLPALVDGHTAATLCGSDDFLDKVRTLEGLRNVLIAKHNLADIFYREELKQLTPHLRTHDVLTQAAYDRIMQQAQWHSTSLRLVTRHLGSNSPLLVQVQALTEQVWPLHR